jgi:hypothetical protein
MHLLAAPLLLLAALGTFASPAESTHERRQIHTLSPRAIAAFKPYSFYAASAYCDPSVLKTWTCGGGYKRFYRGVLDAHRHFQPTAMPTLASSPLQQVETELWYNTVRTYWVVSCTIAEMG